MATCDIFHSVEQVTQGVKILWIRTSRIKKHFVVSKSKYACLLPVQESHWAPLDLGCGCFWMLRQLIQVEWIHKKQFSWQSVQPWWSQLTCSIVKGSLSNKLMLLLLEPGMWYVLNFQDKTSCLSYYNDMKYLVYFNGVII